MDFSEEINQKIQRLIKLLDQFEIQDSPAIQLQRRAAALRTLELDRKRFQQEAAERTARARKQVHSITVYSNKFPRASKTDEEILAEGYAGNNPILKELFAKKADPKK